MSIAEISIRNLESDATRGIVRELESIVSTPILVAHSDREMIEGYILGSAKYLTAFRFIYEQKQHEDAIKRLMFKIKLKYEETELKILF